MMHTHYVDVCISKPSLIYAETRHITSFYKYESFPLMWVFVQFDAEEGHTPKRVRLFVQLWNKSYVANKPFIECGSLLSDTVASHGNSFAVS